MPVEPYLMFNGRCEEAVEFYKKVFGAEVLMMMRFGSTGQTSMQGAPASAEADGCHGRCREIMTNQSTMRKPIHEIFTVDLSR